MFYNGDSIYVYLVGTVSLQQVADEIIPYLLISVVQNGVQEAGGGGGASKSERASEEEGEGETVRAAFPDHKKAV